jgi:putative PIN family toxin of toxin-antitoxin system
LKKDPSCPKGTPLLQAAAEGRAVVLVSPLLLAELREVVNRAKFRRYFTIEEAESFIAALELLAHHVEDPSRDRWVQICPDPDDDYLVALSHRSPDRAPSRTKSR